MYYIYYNIPYNIISIQGKNCGSNLVPPEQGAVPTKFTKHGATCRYKKGKKDIDNFLILNSFLLIHIIRTILHHVLCFYWTFLKEKLFLEYKTYLSIPTKICTLSAPKRANWALNMVLFMLFTLNLSQHYFF